MEIKPCNNCKRQDAHFSIFGSKKCNRCCRLAKTPGSATKHLRDWRLRNPGIAAQRVKRWQEQNPQKKLAHSKVSEAIKKGKLNGEKHYVVALDGSAKCVHLQKRTHIMTTILNL